MKKQVYRVTTLTVGIFAALVILFSHSFSFQPTEKKTDQQEQTGTGTTLQAAPEAIAGSHAVEVQTGSEPTVLQVWVREIRQKTWVFATEAIKLAVRNFFGSTIAPQAP